jgi:hypothetical protein
MRYRAIAAGVEHREEYHALGQRLYREVGKLSTDSRDHAALGLLEDFGYRSLRLSGLQKGKKRRCLPERANS